MKKINFTLLFAFIALMFTNAQGLKGAASIGFPSEDTHTFSIIVDATYLFEVEDNIMAGPFIGYSHSFGDDLTVNAGGATFTAEYDDAQFVPIGASGRYSFTENLYGGLDLGYAIGINDGNDGGFYYAPRVGFSITDTIDIIGAYRGVAVSGGSFNILSAGVEIDL